MSFDNLGLTESLRRALAEKNYTTATPIQEQAIPVLLEGGDLLGIAQTGTGKTAAFMLPSIQLLVAANLRPRPHTCRMLVLAPTRELASQIAESARVYGRYSRLSVGTVFGGVSIGKDRQTLSRGLDILVATPGRLLDLIDQCLLSLKELEILVLDEADQMLDLGFIHALRRIHSLVPANRQSLFFSATMPKAIRELANQFLTDPVTVSVTPVASTAERVDQSVMFVQQAEKQALLTMMIQDLPIERALVFTRTKHGADRVVKLLGGNGIRANAIHGNKSQVQRERALGDFKSGRVKILVATDIAARGIDVSGVSHVFNFELPNVPEQYVHRIGRTARAGASGEAIAFCADDERSYLRDIEKLTRQKVPVVPLPEGFLARAGAIKSQRVREMGADPVDRPRRDIGNNRAPARPRATHHARPTDGRGYRGGDDRQAMSADARPYRQGEPRQGEARQGEARHGDQRALRPNDRQPRTDRPYGDRPRTDRPHGDRLRDDRPRADRPRTDRPQGDRPYGDRPRADRPQGDRQERPGQTGHRPAGNGHQPGGNRGPQRGGNGGGRGRSGPRAFAG
ncbi:DEAD/DEAH box helicase [Sphingomonas sp. GlSt437]|uniref:DEAD/DEAH box helicase n=1 Tax=Sphingomonas sp. GlSt437 TaxID=3389970 RepID=UPI003A896514